MKGHIKYITSKQANDFLLPKHYSGRKPQISQAFGWFEGSYESNGEIKAVCTFGKPASNSLCEGICGKEFSSSVYELNRLCRTDDWNEPLSQFVGACLRYIRAKNWIVVSYSDTGMHHNGYIYQATNFLYTGTTKGRTDKFTEGNKHSRHYSNDKQGEFRKVRTPKNRYVYFAVSHKPTKKKMMKALKYPVLPYPKKKNKNYILGEFQKVVLVNK